MTWQTFVEAERQLRVEAWERYQRQRRVQQWTVVAVIAAATLITLMI